MVDARPTFSNGNLDLSRRGLGALFDYVEEAVLCCDDSGTLTFASAAVRSLLGYDPAAVVGRSLFEFLHPDELQRVGENLQRWNGRAGTPLGEVLRIRASDSSWRPLRYDTVLGTDLGGLGSIVITLYEPEGVDAAGRLLRHRMLGETRLVQLVSVLLELPHERFDEGLDAALAVLAGIDWVTRVSVWRVDHEHPGRVVLRASWTAPTNGPRTTLEPHSDIADYRFLQLLRAGEEIQLDHRWTGGAELERERQLFRANRLKSLLAVPMTSAGEFTGFVMLESTIGDVAFDALATSSLRSAAAVLAAAFVRHDAESRLAAQARTDRITGLGNRWAFDESLADALDDLAHGRSAGFGLALLDLDRFKLVNDELGHGAGDRLLADIATRLRSAADDRTEIARLGGDELLVLVDRSSSLVESYNRVEHLTKALATPFNLMGEAMRVTASVGLVHVDHAGDGPGELLRRADVAMYAAKALGGHTIEVDDPDAEVQEWSSLRREQELREALRSGGLVVHYQGEWDLVSGRLLGAEALVRWQHPTEGLLAAGDFVPLAEERGLIDEVGRVVLRDACRDAAAWSSAMGADSFVLRVNLSADQLRHGDLPDMVADTLHESGLAARSLCLELTESTLLDDPSGSARLFERLRRTGVGLAIDDFGTGYSSILQLKRLPLTALKIDRSFVDGLAEPGIDRAIVRSTLQLAEALGVTTTAEGVETEGQKRALIDLGCTRAQGYLLARPEPAAAFGARVEALVGVG